MSNIPKLSLSQYVATKTPRGGVASRTRKGTSDVTKLFINTGYPNFIPKAPVPKTLIPNIPVRKAPVPKTLIPNVPVPNVPVPNAPVQKIPKTLIPNVHIPKTLIQKSPVPFYNKQHINFMQNFVEPGQSTGLSNQQIIILLLVAAAVYYYYNKEKTTFRIRRGFY